MDSPLYITSEIGKLKTILLHRPGAEVENLTPEYLAELLYDDIPFLQIAQEEHDAFANALRKRGIEVLYLDELTKEALVDPSVRAQFVSEMIQNSKQGSQNITQTLYEYLQSMDTMDMIHKTMAGVRKDEVEAPGGAKQLHEMLDDAYPFYLDPMPNLDFPRDPAAVIGHGLTINKMRFPARRRESLYIQYIIDNHPQFADRGIPKWYTRDQKFSVEGGDILVLSKHAVAIGISQRTSPEAIESIAERILSEGGFKQVIAIEIPKLRMFMHLDTVFTMIDHDKFSVHSFVIEEGRRKMNIFNITRNFDNGKLQIRRRADLNEVLCEALGKNRIEFIPCGGGDIIAGPREQWNDGSNTLAIAPGVVVTYDRNHVTNNLLRQHGIEVIEVPSSELCKARGGPRCMSMPLIREDV